MIKRLISFACLPVVLLTGCANKKIAELIGQRFPGGAGTHAVAPGTTVVQ